MALLREKVLHSQLHRAKNILWNEWHQEKRPGVCPGLRMGERAPAFSLPDMDGENVTLNQLLLQGPVVLLFCFGGWIHAETERLRSYQEASPLLRQMGAQTVVAASGRVTALQEELQHMSFSGKVLADTNAVTASWYNACISCRDYLLQDVPEVKAALRFAGYYSYCPADVTYVIDQDGTVAASVWEAARPNPYWIVNELIQLKER
ncbi:redoxin domain-containing protein [Marinococcus luteus]|uniref:redoxin domain-containing protein n=1 Tax=Marinococcus luteus TaxID=1122204 RepID=UPI002ACC670E|nr:redoxin domain-containing protein [Marinococcus luteus]MDZ5783590.1 redoxin domain-containing protein [Marinococcus luteus]